MRRLFVLILLTGVMGATHVQAQSLDDLMKGISALFATEQAAQAEQEPVKEVYPTVTELLGRLRYDGLAIAYTGDSTIAALAVATLESQLPLISEKTGLVAGRDYMDVAEDGSMLMVRDGKRAMAYCSSYDEQTGQASIMLPLGEQNIYITAVVLKVEGCYRLMFDAQALFALMAKHYPKFEENTTLQMAKGVIDSYLGIRAGVVLKK